MDSSGRTTGVRLPSSASADNITYTYCNTACTQYNSYPVNAYAKNYVRSVLRDGHTWTYSGAPAQAFPNNGQAFGTTATYGYTSPVGGSATAKVNICEAANGLFGCPSVGADPFVQLTDEDGKVFLGPGPVILSVTKPEGDSTGYTWDSRRNLTRVTLNPKPGSSLTAIALTASFDTSCTNSVTCNQPHSVIDGLGKETDYTYDATHGGVLTKTLPADSNGIRPQTTYAYGQRYAWTLNASHVYVPSANPIWVLLSETICRTSSATPTGPSPCSTYGDQVVKTYQYGPNSGPNNLFVRGVSEAADGATHTICYGYDIYGNVVSETKPLAGLTTCP
jgi:YD repeat-containing protein